MEIKEGGELRGCVREAKGGDLRVQWRAGLSAGEMAEDKRVRAIDPSP